MRLRGFLFGVSLLAAAAAPLAAQDDLSNQALLERRLRACLAAGAPASPRDSLLTAVVALRSLCYTQINRVHALRLREVDRSFGLPKARLTASDRNRLAEARRLATRRLGHEVALAVSSFTGLAG